MVKSKTVSHWYRVIIFSSSDRVIQEEIRDSLEDCGKFVQKMRDTYGDQNLPFECREVTESDVTAKVKMVEWR